jgi:hypothetical protein
MSQHPSAEEYRRYLDYVTNEVPVDFDEACRLSRPSSPSSPSPRLRDHLLPCPPIASLAPTGTGLYLASPSSGPPILAKHVVLACGLKPALPPPSSPSPSTLHSAYVSLAALAACPDPVLVGYGESAVDLLRFLSRAPPPPGGRVATVIRRSAGKGGGKPVAPDPSFGLSPRSLDFLRELEAGDHGRNVKVRFVDGYECLGASSPEPGLHAAELSPYRPALPPPPSVSSSHPIVLCTGYAPPPLVTSAVPFAGGVYPDLDPRTDESRSLPGVFLAGPSVRYRAAALGCDKDALLCYVYKFRARAPIVAAEILSRVLEAEFFEGGALDEEGGRILERMGEMETRARELGFWADDLAKAKCRELGGGC